MKVLVTGATGFLGSRVVERLSSLKFDVIATGRNEKVGQLLNSSNCKFIAGDLTDKNFTDKVCTDIDYIIHSAALSSPWGRYNDFYNANVLATKNIISSSEGIIKRLIHISTPSIYVNYNDRYDIKESDPLPIKFANHYAETKYDAEKIVNESFDKGLETIILRPRAILGRGDTTIMPRLIRAQKEGKLRVIGNGKNIADFTSVSNLLDAIILSINAENKALGKQYNITNGDPVKVWNFIDLTLEKLDMKLNKSKVPYPIISNVAKMMELSAKLSRSYDEPVLTCYGVASLAKSITMNIDLAKKYLKYIPKQSNHEVVDEFVNWWKENND